LMTALAAVINHALERSEERERRAGEHERRAVRLAGRALTAGTAMGHAEVLPTLAALARAVPGPSRTTAAPALDLEEMLKRLQVELARAVTAGGATAAEITHLALILEDRRFRERLAEACARATPLRALSELGRAYARVPFATASASAAATELLGDRAAEIEDLCVLAFATTAGGRPLVRSGAIVVSERLGLFATLYAIAAGASAFVVEGEVATDGAAAAAVRASGRPLLAAVGGAFSWLRPDDLLVVDADAGVLRINPPATAVARYRSARR